MPVSSGAEIMCVRRANKRGDARNPAQDAVRVCGDGEGEWVRVSAIVFHMQRGGDGEGRARQELVRN